jgi:hypothetical protein
LIRGHQLHGGIRSRTSATSTASAEWTYLLVILRELWPSKLAMLVVADIVARLAKLWRSTSGVMCAGLAGHWRTVRSPILGWRLKIASVLDDQRVSGAVLWCDCQQIAAISHSYGLR